jgi:hypothetical protein
MKLSSSIRTPVKIEKPSTGAHGTEVSSVFQKSAKTEESGALAKSTLKATPHPFPGIRPDGGHCKRCINRGTDLLDLVPNPHRPRVDFQVATFMQQRRYKISRLNPLAIQARLSGSTAFQYGLMHVRASTGRQSPTQPSNSQAVFEPSSSPQLTEGIRSLAPPQTIESPIRLGHRTQAGQGSVQSNEITMDDNQNFNATEEPAAFILR